MRGTRSGQEARSASGAGLRPLAGVHMLRTDEAARMLGVSVNLVHKWVHDGVLDAITTPSGDLRFDASLVRAVSDGLSRPEPRSR
ncbi:hypothetical protein GCM10009774_33220 [Cellulomonas gelida]|uniref:Helix-turn-helix domain-containing protein n=2 Tax=Cellulomonas gelida TaxID=1712 RepID=A0A4Y3KMG6_9CELL|nr:hypothetical protein CGE01nite_20870 [Cellulomonas gelida]GGL39878.1 hypothetical protein GCM10009774_33220 [Cellulomonas gelida]